ncbi:major facilitator family transporter [Geobacillus stearothermophilus]|uniref:Major facilitator family transporter n=1 Tax=Geobacillus stearothermophilus TaxID=1422 RepID=A0ABQ7HF80_GEOSE|nr:major facilitator family transporter [Geobacillus stearothermophilus]
MRFAILTAVVAISGLSQGMLLPLLAMLLDEQGVPSSVNGVHAAALYIGVLAISPFLERPLVKYGYRPIILLGGSIVICSLTLFPLFSSFFIWLALRFLIGVGDHMLHFATQTWITDFSLPAKRGRRLSLYGLAFGLGFTAGPLLASLASINEAWPFYLAALLSFSGWVAVFWLPKENRSRLNALPQPPAGGSVHGNMHGQRSCCRLPTAFWKRPFIPCSRCMPCASR